MKFYGFVFVSSYTLTSQLLTINNLSNCSNFSQSTSNYDCGSKSESFFESFKNYLKGISFSKSNF